jgi:hypothetical protein
MSSSPPTPTRLGIQPRLVSEWNSQFAESAKLEAAIKANREGLGFRGAAR